MTALIYHGTPITPRAALEAILPGRAACVSFYRPDDLEALLATCPQIMFRSRRLFILDGGHARWEGMGRGRARGMVAGLLPLAGVHHLASGPMGDHAGQPGGAVPAQYVGKLFRISNIGVVDRPDWEYRLFHNG